MGMWTFLFLKEHKAIPETLESGGEKKLNDFILYSTALIIYALQT